MGYTIKYENFPIIWVIQLQTEISISTMEAEYIALYKAMNVGLPLLILMKEIEFVLELQGYVPKMLHSILKKTVTVRDR